jgi:hypothetical protein
MAVRRNGDLQVTTLVLRKDQIRRMDALRELRSTRANRATRSDVAREVFEAGLELLFRNRFSTIGDSTDGDVKEAA